MQSVFGLDHQQFNSAMVVEFSNKQWWLWAVVWFLVLSMWPTCLDWILSSCFCGSSSDFCYSSTIIRFLHFLLVKCPVPSILFSRSVKFNRKHWCALSSNDFSGLSVVWISFQIALEVFISNYLRSILLTWEAWALVRNNDVIRYGQTDMANTDVLVCIWQVPEYLTLFYPCPYVYMQIQTEICI